MTPDELAEAAREIRTLADAAMRTFSSPPPRRAMRERIERWHLAVTPDDELAALRAEAEAELRSRADDAR